MRRFQISEDEDRLTLTLNPGYQRVIPGCMMLGFTFLCVTVLAVLAIVKGNVGGAPGDMNFINPRANHFGFLWLTTSLLASVLTPLYAFKVILAPIVFRFDRETNLFTRCGKTIAPLGKVEHVRIVHSDDTSWWWSTPTASRCRWTTGMTRKRPTTSRRPSPTSAA
jgi:hypothetical protein